ncbi:MAG: glycosyltransferase [Chloroflexi bacterium]|nr:MAG: glycosyltransferase [Chloroflexota bacterium]
MRVALFYHSLVSDWNHGNAHFLRGFATELKARGHEVRTYEPRSSWSRLHLVRQQGQAPLEAFRSAYPGMRSEAYTLSRLNLDAALEGVDLALVHEWNDGRLVRRLGEYRARSPRLRLLFHDTHHRSVTAPRQVPAQDLRDYDGVLAFGAVIRDLYLQRGWTQRAWTWHEAADVRVFRPPPSPQPPAAELVWIGNWGDEERSRELRRFLIEPVGELGLRATVHGVRYPARARAELAAAGLDYRGWIANFEVPSVFAKHLVTVHVPRRVYADRLPGIPTIRPFEAMACGIPLVSAPWDDSEGLFRPGTDHLVVRSKAEMKRRLRELVADPAQRAQLAAEGLRTIRARHTCGHRVDQLLAIAAELGAGGLEAVA